MDTVSLEPLTLNLTPIEAAQRLCHLPGFVFLDSGAATGGPHQDQLSLLAAQPRRVHQGSLHRDAHRLRDVLRRHRLTAVDCGLPLGGLLGSVDYDGRFVFGEYASLLAYHHQAGRWQVVGHPPYLEQLVDSTERSRPAPAGPPLAFDSGMPREAFLRMVKSAQEGIAAGEIYQVNLAHQFRAPRRPLQDAFQLYRRLRTVSPAPFSAFMNLGGRQVLSSSPECFLKMSGRGILTRPIKGTRPRSRDPLLDRRAAEDLLASPKESAELVMITDLQRNDLGRLSDYGSVHVRDLLRLERYAQVFHLVSTVSAQLRPEIDHLEALRLCSPGGSITGAPKRRAMDFIAGLEPVPRGLYTGALGYLGWNGESQFNIVIRTLIGEADHWHFHSGAGIVADSDPAAEYEETLHKAAGILMACGAAPR